MSTGFQFFEGTTTESAEVAKITVRRGGILVLTRATVGLLGDGVSHVQLAFNPKAGAVGARACDADTSGSYLLRSQKNSPARLISGKRFFTHHGLEIEKARTYPAEEFGGGIIGFHLGDETGEAEVKSAPKKTEPKKPVRRKTKTAA